MRRGGGGGGGAYATNNTQLTPINFLASQVAACTWSAHAPAAVSSGVGCARPSGRVIAWAPIGLAKPAQKTEQREYFIYIHTYMHIYCVSILLTILYTFLPLKTVCFKCFSIKLENA